MRLFLMGRSSSPDDLCPPLINLLVLESAGSDAPKEPHRTMEEINQWVLDYIGLLGADRTKRDPAQGESRSQWGLNRTGFSCWQWARGRPDN